MAAHWKKYQAEYAIRNYGGFLMRNYGLTVDDFNEMARLQSGCCAICGSAERQLVVDHCHESGHVRALLCNNCNTGLGMFGDNVDMLISAVAYLVRDESRRQVPG
jgi:hypothetical protein